MVPYDTMVGEFRVHYAGFFDPGFGFHNARGGGTKAVLVRAPKGTDVHYIAVSVLEGFEKTMSESFIKARPEGGVAVGEFATREAALATP